MEELLNPVQEETVEVVDVQFRPGQKVYFFDPDGIHFETGDHVVMDTARGPEFGICAAGNHTISQKDVVAPLRKILRKANSQDEKTNAENRNREKRAYEICLQKIEHHGLDMQLVSAECAFDGSKILFYFTADERVDFRELVKDLASVFHTRIELRQIGVRDKAKMVGGLGICGRPFCCASFLDDFQPVSIKMAKTQNLSLNPTKISGTCGRLMCCLKYEQDTYESLIRTSPKAESFVDTPEGRGTVVEADILRQRVKVQMEDNPETVSVFSNEEIAVLRSGKARKNDPPIPADLAPISGNGKRAHRKQNEEEAPVLEPIRFRYSTEMIVEEPAEPAQERPEQRPARSRRRRGEPRPEPQNALSEPGAQSPEEPGAQTERPPRPRREPRQRKFDRQNRDRAPEQSRAEQPGKTGAEQPEKVKSEPAEKPGRQPRGNRPPKRNATPAVSDAAPAASGTAPQSEAAQPEGEQKKPRRRPNYYRHRKPKAPQT